jgi:uncharacterized protein (DUF1015 family)
MKTFPELGIKIPNILLPAQTGLENWSVIACDQYTQDRAYWKKAEKTAADNPSTLNMILPEVYLDDNDKEQRIKNIHTTMRQYLDSGIFAPELHTFIYLERNTSYGRTRKGLMVEIDLETYEWKPFSSALIRATEATIPERIPPRKEIRNNAPLETPHIMLLVNDPEHRLVEAAGTVIKKSGRKPVYSGKLMMNGGSITGWTIEGDTENVAVLKSLNDIADKNKAENGSTFLFAVGDGNHSLATAKAVWDDYKKTLTLDEQKTSDIRYALVEIVNIYDEGLSFEPIHRVLFGAAPEEAIEVLKNNLGGTVSDCKNKQLLEYRVKNSKKTLGFIYRHNGETIYACLETPVTGLAVAHFQPVIDSFIKNTNGKVTIDYIHGNTEIERLGEEDNTIGILLPPVAKDSFFATISSHGPLPRKSFSMGEADEKRFYLECRKLFP